MILRRILAGTLSIVMMMCFLPLQQFTPILQEITASASAAEVVASGECGADGDNLIWTLDDEGMLTISGQGEMADGGNGVVLPWFEYDYKSINSITILDGVTSIGDHAFQDCTSLTSIIIPNSVKSIGMFALRNTEWLVQKQNENPLVVVNGILIDGTTSNGSVIVPESVTMIGGGAFNACDNLTDIVIPDSVISIGQYAFTGCDGLTDIIIPNGVTSIESDAFSYCNNLANVIISDGVVSIGYYAFSYCERLITIEIPGSVKNIGVRAFSDTPWMAQQQAETPLVVVNGILIDGTTSTGSVIIPDDVTSIGWNAFSNCESLTSITIPNSVTSIEWGAFSNCDNLTSITIPNSVTNIEGSAFSSCDNLTTVIIPNSVTNIDDYVFHGTPWLTQQQAKSPLVVVNGILIDGTTSNGSVTIPDDVMSVGSYAFGFCDNLSTITISNSVTSIKRGAFNGCDNLTTITIPDSVISVDNSAFSSCNNLTDVYYTGTEEEWNAITINSGNKCLTNATIHYNYVDELPSVAFGTFNGLTWKLDTAGCLTISGNGMMYWPEEDKAPWNNYTNSINTIVIEKGVINIADGAFAACINATEVSIPETVTSIGREAFQYCESLSSIVIPDGVELIESWTFASCHKLTEIYIPESVAEIEAFAFSGDSLLTDVYYGGIQRDWENINGIDDFNSELLSAEVHIDEVYEHMRFYEDNQKYITGMNDMLLIGLATEAENDTAAYLYSMIEDPEKIFGTDEYEQKMVVQMVVTELLCSEELNTDMAYSFMDGMDKAQDTVLKGIQTATLAGDIIMDDNEYQELERVLAMDVTSPKYKEAKETLLKKHLVNLNAEKLKTILETAGFVVTFTDAIYEDTMQLYNCYLAYQAYSQLDQEMKETLLLLRDKLQSLALQGNDERIIVLAEEFSTQINRISSEDSSWMREYAEELIQEDLAGYLADETKELVFDYAKKIVAVAMPELSAFLTAADIVLNIGIKIFVAVTKINDRALERDIFLNLFAFEDAAAAVINEDYGPNLQERQGETSSKYFECGFQVYKKIRVMLMEHAKNYAALRDKNNYDYWNKQIATNLWECHGSFADYDRCKRIAANEIESDIEENLQTSKNMVTAFTSYLIDCPVSVIVSNEGVVCAELTDEGSTIYEQNAWTEYMVYYSSEDAAHPSKMILVPKEYEVIIIGTDTGTMSFEKATIENGNVTTISTISDIPVQSGSSYTEVIEDNVTVAVECDLDSNGVTDEILTAEVTESVFTQGDVDGNGQVDISDATAVLTMYAKTAADLPIDEYTEIHKKSADVDGDGLLTISDATNILTYYAKNAAGLNPTWDKILA